MKILTFREIRYKIAGKTRYLIYTLLFLGGLILGWLIYGTGKGDKNDHKEEATESSSNSIWTCSMHPQIRKSGPGDCPICGMDLIPLSKSGGGGADADPAAVYLSKEAAQLANVETTIVTREMPVREVSLYGKVMADERLVQSQVAHIPGRIEKLMVNFTGEAVKKGQVLAMLYSPELVTAQQELIEASAMKDKQPEIYEASVERLRLWKLTEEQISSVETSGKLEYDFPIVSNTRGVVTALKVNSGDHVNQGTVLFEVADLSKVWIQFDAYESDLPFISTGDPITFKVQAIPGRELKGVVRFIDPVIDPVTRVSRVRVEMNNESGMLKPEMFVTGTIKARLEKRANSIVIPQSAVLWTGKRSIVYVKEPGDEPVFKLREIVLGPRLSNSYVVESGLKEGEEIVTEGAFSVDAAAQLEGKPSMMNNKPGTGK